MVKKKKQKDWDKFGEEVGKRMVFRFGEYKGPSIGFPIVLILIGIYIIGKDFGWFPAVSVWAVILIAFGILLLFSKLRYKCR